MNRVFVWNEQVASPVGPFDLEVFLQLVEAGVIRADTLVATDGEETWTVAGEHPATAYRVRSQLRSGSSAGAMSTRTTGSLGGRASGISSIAAEPEPVRHSAYDPDYDLDLLDLNPGKRRTLRDFALLAGALNAAVLAGALLLPFSPITAALLASLFFGGNVSLSWIFGVVLR
jgi:hypothetical protein